MYEFASKEKMFSCMKDLGCDDSFIEEFKKPYESDDVKSQIKMLTEKRKELLDELHASQKRIDCMDYIIYKLEKKEKEK